ncbi:hypothetical protein ZIOFF_063832 [Zingiber officinale]|uniref:Uncharacterized protein n=1 Tax=Zingiber officinale TaxID=94328 RepID=A0A8J5F6S8_ZINOF|nr:hypothetical protein ZIOFF_063832 [Zingiber officinale]
MEVTAGVVGINMKVCCNRLICFCSIGNFFFAGARIFFQSLDAAVFLFSRVSDIPNESLVLPVISTNDRLTLGCELWDCASISKLPSGIKRVFYMSSEGCNLLHEVFPAVNPTVLEQLGKVDCIVYAMGSLFTSICPSLWQPEAFAHHGQCVKVPDFAYVLGDGTRKPCQVEAQAYLYSWAIGSSKERDVLNGIGEIIASRSIPKVLLLNGKHDRETTGLSASGFVTAITDALNRTYGDPGKSLKNGPFDYINALLVPQDGQIPIDLQCLAAQGIFRVVHVDCIHDPKVEAVFEPKSLMKALGDLIVEYEQTDLIMENDQAC